MIQKASKIEHTRLDLGNGLIVEIKIWKLPIPTDERPHGLKYSLFFGRDGERIVGYDNEVGKGDHRHYRTKEEPYAFKSMEQLFVDFWADVKREETRNE